MYLISTIIAYVDKYLPNLRFTILKTNNDDEVDEVPKIKQSHKNSDME